MRLSPELSGYELLVDVGGERRELHDQDCRELMRAAVVIAVALLEPSPGAAEPVVDSPHEELAFTQSEPLRAAAPKSAARRAWRVAFAPGVGLEFGMLPQPSLLLEGDAQLKWDNWGFAAGARYFAQSSVVRDPFGHGVRVGGLATYAAGVFDPGPNLQARIGLELLRLSGTGLGSVERSHGSVWDFGPTVGLSFVPFARPPFWTSIGVEGQLNLLRPHFEILSYAQVFRVPQFSGSTFARAGMVW